MPPDRWHRPFHHPHRPPPRPNPAVQSSEETTVSSPSHLLQTDPIRIYPLFSRLRIYVIPTKLDGELPAIYAQIEALGGVVAPLEKCTFAVTTLKGRPRLEKVIGGKWLGLKQVVRVDYVKDCYDACLRYASTDTSSWATMEFPLPPPILPPRSTYLVGSSGPSVLDNKPIDEPLPSHPPDLEPLAEDCALEDVPRSAIKRCSPLICPNQDIVSVLYRFWVASLIHY